MATKTKQTHSFSILLKPKLFLLLLWLLLFILFFIISKPSQTNTKPYCNPNISPFYIYTLPSHFNQALLQQCHKLNIYTDMCPHVANQGLGRRLNGTWHATHQFIAEMIFHSRAERHPCRTLDPGAAKMFYVPFYAGLYASSKFREPDYGARDVMAVELAEFVARQANWRRRDGRDHFLVVGRTAWDFMRPDDLAAGGGDFGANRLFLLPPIKKMSILTVERHPWQGENQFGIPYPSYFHPLTADEMRRWQASVQESNRSHLYSFVGGPRVGLEKAAVRDNILRQCAVSDRCIRVHCDPGSVDCHEPDRVLEVMKRSVFCMQPPGDSFTRRSVFDAILAGCIPVFFSDHTAYSQYNWYFSGEREEWSVFIGEERWDEIEEELGRIPKERVKTMRAKVIEMIPNVTYAHPNASHAELQDAVDVALIQLTRRIRDLDETF